MNTSAAFDVVHLQITDSTNSHLKSEGFSKNTIVYTFNQTAGRGRLSGRKWHNFPDKNLALSALYFPVNEHLNTVWIVAYFSVILVRILRRMGLDEIYIKWPNDIYHKSGKLAGILAEAVWNGGKMTKIITGIGININPSGEEISAMNLNAASVRSVTNKEINIDDFTGEFIKELSNNIDLLENGVDKLREEWLKDSAVIGRKAEYLQAAGGAVRNGVITEIDNDGFLHLDTGEEIIKVVSGDINLL